MSISRSHKPNCVPWRREEDLQLDEAAQHKSEDAVPVGVVETAAAMPAASRIVAGGVKVVATGSAEAVASGQRLVFGGEDSTAKEAAVDTKSSATKFLAAALYGSRHRRAPVATKAARKKLSKGMGAPAKQFVAPSVGNAAAVAAAKSAHSAARKRSRR